MLVNEVCRIVGADEWLNEFGKVGNRLYFWETSKQKSAGGVR